LRTRTLRVVVDATIGSVRLCARAVSVYRPGAAFAAGVRATGAVVRSWAASLAVRGALAQPAGSPESRSAKVSAASPVFSS
jgi:hypothetical protein